MCSLQECGGEGDEGGHDCRGCAGGEWDGVGKRGMKSEAGELIETLIAP